MLTETNLKTDIKKNHNKYYIIQVLKKDNASKFICFTKWGRVGAKAGQKEEPFSDMDSAILSFQSKFREKTTNDWDDRHNFVHKKGKYFLLERGDEEELPKLKPESHEPPPPTPESKLPEQVQDLMKLIFDIDSMTKEMMSIGYDATKAPLGQLSKKTIQQGYEKLKKISEAIQTNANMDTLMDLSSEFYTVIPHVYKNNQRPEVIRNFEMVKIKLTMVEALADIEIATKLLDETKAIHDANPIDTRYNSLQCGLQPIDHSTDEFKMVVDYTRNTHASTHNYYGLEVLDIFEVDREGELERYSTGKGGEIKSNRQLLWHGSRMSNFAGILSQGLRIAPPSAPVSGYMFGKGVYFANMVSKSANYCFTSPENNVGLLLLCEVALGEPNELLHSDYNADRAMEKAGKHCTKGCGSTAPDPKGSIVLKDGTLVPMGKGISSGVQGSLLYDELIVYDITQIKIRYLVKMKFDYKNKRY
ncbi:poly polymerase catalytic domain-containing protein [Cladochytrium replicatum]|nr:poly polymerase catalytic domain-containing protein [Cladochytrium replicatum]